MANHQGVDDYLRLNLPDKTPTLFSLEPTYI